MVSHIINYNDNVLHIITYDVTHVFAYDITHVISYATTHVGMLVVSHFVPLVLVLLHMLLHLGVTHVTVHLLHVAVAYYHASPQTSRLTSCWAYLYDKLCLRPDFLTRIMNGLK